MPKPTLCYVSVGLHWGKPLHTHLMDEEHCAIAVPLRICEVRYAADKRRYNVFLICPVARPQPESLGSLTLQKYNFFPI